MTLDTLTEEHWKSWHEDGIVLLERAIIGSALARLQTWISELEQMPGTADGLLQYDESTPRGERRRCRTENFIPFHDALRTLVTTGAIPKIAGALLGDGAVVYKEKVNYKAPGGAGFAPHQDAPAYPFVERTVACMVAVDQASVANGCLEIVRGSHQRQLTSTTDGCISPLVAERLKWEPVPVPAGSLLFFHCFVPHRSGANTSSDTRRAIYLTYNAASEGDRRADYYAAKLPRLAENPERLSLIGHFTGSAMPLRAGGAR